MVSGILNQSKQRALQLRIKLKRALQCEEHSPGLVKVGKRTSQSEKWRAGSEIAQRVLLGAREGQQ